MISAGQQIGIISQMIAVLKKHGERIDYVNVSPTILAAIHAKFSPETEGDFHYQSQNNSFVIKSHDWHLMKDRYVCMTKDYNGKTLLTAGIQVYTL